MTLILACSPCACAAPPRTSARLDATSRVRFVAYHRAGSTSSARRRRLARFDPRDLARSGGRFDGLLTYSSARGSTPCRGSREAGFRAVLLGAGTRLMRAAGGGAAAARGADVVLGLHRQRRPVLQRYNAAALARACAGARRSARRRAHHDRAVLVFDEARARELPAQDLRRWCTRRSALVRNAPR
jgi:hypothetical protein